MIGQLSRVTDKSAVTIGNSYQLQLDWCLIRQNDAH